ncbi:hypothetical protein Dform_00845 [Dehalogenimonas formicexedens]|uniref:Uncharacterized protein n=1 Tax=Dehalogenimonas formicexedens TaxID=1839801 RepID=A0A1P8F6Y1_9CHLR|nr:hypothetical protein [Dehalogenimonas formicexedens]APV44190.1 hypothetical protein Dform_00845 [Dehalogenimonas formicexedens]
MVILNRALIETATGKVLNVCAIDPAKAWAAPAGTTLLSEFDSAGAEIGATWDGTKFTRAAVVVTDIRAEFAALGTVAAKIDFIANRLGLR